MGLLGSKLKRRKLDTVNNSFQFNGRSIVWGLVQNGSTDSFPDILQVKSNKGVSRRVMEKKCVDLTTVF